MATYSKVEANGNGRKAAVKKISPLAQERIALSDIINPLQQGIFSKDSSGEKKKFVSHSTPVLVHRNSQYDFYIFLQIHVFGSHYTQ